MLSWPAQPYEVSLGLLFSQTGTPETPLDPLLGLLQNNGGLLIGGPGHKMNLRTELLLSGSPAVGQGILTGAPATDARGFLSVIDGTINVGATSSWSYTSTSTLATWPLSWAWHGHLDDLIALLTQTGTEGKHL
jgi:hypothetical protein